MLLNTISGNIHKNLLSEPERLDLSLYHLRLILIRSIPLSLFKCLIYLCEYRPKVPACDLHLDLLSCFSTICVAAHLWGNLLVRFYGADSH